MKNLARFFDISRTLIRYRLDSLVLSTPFLKSVRWLVYFIPWHYFPIKKYSEGERIRLAFEQLGPIFVKFGQTLSTRRDLLPEDIGRELAKLQDSCQPFSGQAAKSMIEKALGDSTKNLFKRFDEQPLASASIAQVHTALTHDDEEVVVKVLRPKVEAKIKQDIRLMYFFARLINKHSISKKVRPVEIVKEFEDIILYELNLMNEAMSAKRLKKNFENSDLLYVPKVYFDLCRENVLTTERIYGTPIGDVGALRAKGTNLKKLAEDGVIIFFTQVFEHNFFHADMHPGNIFVGEKDNYIGVDFGIMGSLSEEDKDFLADIFLSFFNRDYHGVAQSYIDAGWASPTTDVVAFENAVQRICEPMFEKSLGDISFGQVLLDLIQEAKNFDISIQPQLLLLDKTLLNVEGLGRVLYPQLDLWATAKPFLENLVKKRHSMKNSFERLKERAPQLLKEVPELPELIVGALKKINQPKDIERMHQQQTEVLIKQLKINATKQNFALIGSTLAILSGIFAVNFWWEASISTLILGVIFWIKSKT